ncbi:hemerythrin domain-containing protein [Azovibrio restrictus]|uniref:hemerythrin domain-containing protein n=1 Tax=Azovibrio restrictus TaxID=146938 RepID=UPI0026ED3E04|nr:hemerythrin domain-containing protein [Azovibrio restrictus]
MMEWQERYELGHVPMDATHQEFVHLVNALAVAGNEDVVAALKALIVHTEAHFAQEKLWMEASGFPPIHCHVGEHERVLESLGSVLAMAEKGNPGLGRVVAGELQAWFEQHAATMDAALAWHMRQAGYVPEAVPA